MRAAICAVESRLDNYVADLLKVIEPQVDDVKLFIDYERKGQTWNYKRMFREMLTNAKKDEPILLMEDDVITIPAWKQYWESIHKEAKNDLYVMFSRQRHLFKEENMKRGYVTKCQLRGLYVPATIWINGQDMPDYIENWYETKGKKVMTPQRQKHWDVVVQNAIIDMGKEYTILTPSLFEHVGIKSTLGHKIGGAVKYIGDVS